MPLGCVQTESKIEIENRNHFVFGIILADVSKQKRIGKQQDPGEKQLRAQAMGCSQLCTHADNLALGTTGPPEEQAEATTIRYREVVGPPMEVVACPTLTPRDQNSNYTESELPTSFSRADAELYSNSLRFGSNAGKQRP